ncbi:MAG: NEW3 domain-containing protein [Pseudomonadota bacterium]|nr:NEW3 domain-containing protein [Pseudomonadota bacterium]
MLKQTQPRLSQLASAVAVVLGGITLLPSAHAAAPAAGTNISNIASASYTDAGGNPLTTTSNEVTTTVLQVASFTLVEDRNTISNPNSTVNLSHTLTNTGNGTDSFEIDLVNLGGDDYDFTNIGVYLDANGDGVPDDPSANLIGETITLPAGDAVNLIVQGTTPSGQAIGTDGQLQITATSVFDNAVTEQNTDTVVISAGDFVVRKSANVSIAQIGDEVEYTLTYTNRGNAAATDILIRDALPANVTYVDGSAVWSNAAGSLTDVVDGDGYSFDAAGRIVEFTIPSVAPNVTGTLKFRVTVDAATPAGDIVNQAEYQFDPDGPGGEDPTPLTPTNETPVEVPEARVGVINDSATNPYSDAQRDPTDVDLDDTQTQTIAQGATATFTTYVHNTGNLEQVFEVLINQTDLPAGSTVELFKADGATPLTNISGTAALDVGPIAAGDMVELVVKITLPATFTETGVDTSDTIITVHPVGAPTATDSTILVIDDVTPARIDLSNGNVADYTDANVETAEGEGPYDPVIVVDSENTTPGEPVRFPLEIYNGGANPDSFNLTHTVPPGWTVQYEDAAGNIITNLTNVQPGDTVEYFAVVTPPVDAPVGDNDVIFTVTSPITQLTDSMKNNVTIQDERLVTFSPDRQGETTAGGTVTYLHTFTNNGSAIEGDDAGELLVNMTQGGSFTGNVTVFVDVNKDGIFAPNETLVLDGAGNGDLNSLLPAGVNPGESYSIQVKVESPVTALPGQNNTTTVVITPTGDINGVTPPPAVQIVDRTVISEDPLRLVKSQALDTDCDGVADGAYGTGTLAAEPGACIVYRIVATNEGSGTVTNVVINDTTPAYTTLSTAAVATVGAISATPALGGTGTITNQVGSLAPAANAQLDFGVEIDE